MTTAKKRALIFGISGQDGAYLSQLLLGKGYEVHGTSRDAEMSTFKNLAALDLREKISAHSAAPTDFRSTWQAVSRVRPYEIYDLSGQSSVGLSFQQPAETMESITIGTLNILEAMRFADWPVRLYSAGSGECFGDTGGQAANECTAFHPRSPYAVAKSAAFWEIANYRDAYDLFACSGILFNHESPLRPERFVTRKIVAAAARIGRGSTEKLTLGDLSVRRDWGWAPDYVEAMWLMLQQDRPADFVIATGQHHALEDFVAETFRFFEIDWRDHVEIDKGLFRPSEIPCGFGAPRKADQELGWHAKATMHEVVRRMAGAEAESLA